LIYKLGRYLFTEAVGLISALLLALSPVFINHAQEVRYYSLSVCLTLAGSLFLAHALENPRSWTMRLGWTITRFLAIITVPFNAVLLAPDFLLVGVKFYKQRRILLAFGPMLVVILVLIVPSAFSLIGGVAAGKHRLVGPIPGIRELFRELRILTFFPYPPRPDWTLFINLFVLVLLAVLGIALFKKPHLEKIMWVAAWAFLPLAIIFVYSNISASIWITRYFIFVGPYIFILLAIGFLKIWQHWRRLALVTAILYAIAIGTGLVTYYSESKRYMGANGDAYRSIAQTINADEKPGDVIVFSSIHRTSMPLEHYHRGSAPIYLKDPILPEKLDRNHIENWLSSLPSTGSRLWLVSGEGSTLFCDVVNEKFEIIKTYDKFGKCNFSVLKPKTKTN